MMIRAAICDDNKQMLDFLKEKIDADLTEYGMSHEISSYLSGRDFLNDHRSEPFDVVFLDIVMPDIDGFEAAKQVKRISEKTYIIFVTTESTLVYDSFDYSPFYFIPKGKPEILKIKLKDVIAKLVERINENQTICFDLPRGEKKYISSDQIIYITSRSNYLDIVCRTETIHIRRKLNDILDELSPKSFARIHNRIIVNMRYVSRIDNTRFKAILYDETELDISRAYKTGFSENYNIYLRNFS